MPQGQDLDWRPERLRCDRLVAPAGISTAHPRFSWRLPAFAGDDPQVAFQVLAGTGPESGGPNADVWDSGWVGSGMTEVAYGGRPLESRETVTWWVRASTASRGTSDWSMPAHFDVGLLSRDDWSASWVGRPPVPGQLPGRAAYLLRRRFGLSSVPVRARAFVTALGTYELWVNATRVGDGLLRPGWTDYRRRAQYQVVDVTPFLVAGDNIIGAVLAPGWYAGRIDSRAAAGSAEPVPVPELLCQLEMEQGNGVRTTIVTDENWEWRPFAILSSDLYDGEDWDRRLLDWRWASIDDVSQWEGVECTRGTGAALVPERAEPIRVINVSQSKVTWRDDGSALVDSGRNDTGFLRLKVDEARGRKISVSYGEILDPAGRLYRENLRDARCTDTFVCGGDGPRSSRPASRTGAGATRRSAGYQRQTSCCWPRASPSAPT